ncbi:MAG: galactose-1-phosphate uridylyltransferase, partial [Eubacteriales bacterium]
MVSDVISQLVAYGIGCGLLDAKDRLWAINGILEIMELDVFVDPNKEWGMIDLPRVLSTLCDDAVARGLIAENTLPQRDLFDTKLMGRLTPRPSHVVEAFWKHHQVSPQNATDWFYHFSQSTNYIRRDRVSKDRRWVTPSPYGDLDITINLSKPELDPADIAKARSQPTSPYPRCLLCEENEGYAGRLNHPARQHHRTIPITLHGASYFLQF